MKSKINLGQFFKSDSTQQILVFLLLIVLGLGAIIYLTKTEIKTEIGTITKMIHEPAHTRRGVRGIVGFTAVIADKYVPERFAICLKIRNKMLYPLEASESFYKSLRVGEKLEITYKHYRCGDETKEYIWLDRGQIISVSKLD